MSGTSEDSLRVTFVSSWHEGEVRSRARLDLKTGEVRDIEVSELGEDYEHLIEEYIESLDGLRWAPVICQEAGGEYRLAGNEHLSKFRN
jgi:hypothetical protein